MARVFLAPDGNEYFAAPTNTREANEWLSRSGVSHIKFATQNGSAVLKDTNSSRVYLRAEHISDICYFLAFNPMQMKVFGIPFYDWYREDSVWSTMGPVTIYSTY